MSGKKLIAFRAGLETVRQLEKLSKELGESVSAVIIRAIDRMAREKKK